MHIAICLLFANPAARLRYSGKLHERCVIVASFHLQNRELNAGCIQRSGRCLQKDISTGPYETSTLLSCRVTNVTSCNILPIAALSITVWLLLGVRRGVIAPQILNLVSR
jgi:hypothetical protein